jgi:hypothetical protein
VVLPRQEVGVEAGARVNTWLHVPSMSGASKLYSHYFFDFLGDPKSVC